MTLYTCYACGKQIEPNEPMLFSDINNGACATGAGNFKPFHSSCTRFSAPPFVPYYYQWLDGK